MRTGLKILGSMTLVLFFISVCSCKTRSVESDMTEWCQCRETAKSPADCNDLMEKIVREYEFDPKALVVIRTKISECNNK